MRQINVDTSCVGAHYCTRHHYNLSPTFQGDTSDEAKPLPIFYCPNY